MKKREAERIDRENQKIMERIIKQVPSVSSKKMEQEYQDTTIRFKKMKQKSLAISVEKIIEKKKKHQNEIKSNLLPLISQSVKNQNQPETTFPVSRNHRYTELTTISD